VSALRRWLLLVFGREYLTSGSGIVDVAGGKGEFSFESLNLNGIPSTVFDPRPLDLYRYKRKLQFGFYHRNEVLGSYNHVAQPSDGIPAALPRHIRGFFQMFDSSARGSVFPTLPRDQRHAEAEAEVEKEGLLPLVLRSEEAFVTGLQEARGTNWTTKGLTHEEEDEGEVNCAGDREEDEEEGQRESEHSRGSSNACPSSCSYNSSSVGREAEPGEEVESLEEGRRIMQDCSVLVGMHPDQVRRRQTDRQRQTDRGVVRIECMNISAACSLAICDVHHFDCSLFLGRPRST
jgi:hypothetical protein